MNNPKLIAPPVSLTESTFQKKFSAKEILASKCLDPLEVMEIMKISNGTLFNLCKQDLLQVSKIGNRFYFDIEDLVKMLDDGKIRYRNERIRLKKR